MMGRRLCNCVTVGLVCLCLGQGVKAPPSNVFTSLLSAGTTSSAGTASVVGISPRLVDLTSGKLYQMPQQLKSLYGEIDNRQGRLIRSG
jgi:hypothetical protein